jgi:hypothetical protein
VIELCRVESFSFAEGTGVLVTGAAERVPFDVSVFRVGGYRPTAAEAELVGTARSPISPRVGEVVAVVWRADVTDRPETVSRVTPALPRFTLTEWLAGVNERTDLLDGITARRLRHHTKFDPRRGRAFTAADASWILQRVREVERAMDEPPSPWVVWVDADDPEAWEPLQELLELDVAIDPESPTFASYLAQLNAAAEEAGIDLRLFEIDAEGAQRFVIALEPDQLSTLVADGYVRGLWAAEPMPRGASSIEEARAWLEASVAKSTAPRRFGPPSAFELVAASRRIFHALAEAHGFEPTIEPGPPDRFVATHKVAGAPGGRAVLMFQEIEERGGRAHRFRLVDHDRAAGPKSGVPLSLVDELVRQLDDRMRLEAHRFLAVEELETHLCEWQDDWARTIAGLRLTHEDLDEEGIWLSTSRAGGEEWVELTVGVTNEPADPIVALEAAALSPLVTQRQGESLELRATLPLSAATGARIIELCDLLIVERALLLDELFGVDPDPGTPG